MELFMVGTFWFWCLIIAEIIILFSSVENDSGIFATGSLLVTLCLLQWGGGPDIVGYVKENPLTILSCVGGYFALGCAWGVCKWWLFCHDALDKYVEFRSNFLRQHNRSDLSFIPDELKVKFKSDLSNGGYKTKHLGQTPNVVEHKSDIVRWMTFWVISMVWSFVDDFVKRIFKSIYYRMSNKLQQMSDKMFANINSDLE